MVDGSRHAFPRHPWDVVIAVVAGVALVAVIALAALTTVPPAVANIGSEVSDGATPVRIGDAAASVVVPSGWVVVGQGTGVVTVRSPDAVLSVRLSSGGRGVDATLQAALGDASAGAGEAEHGAPLTERLSSGATLVHADVGDRFLAGAIARRPDAAAVAIVAGVGDGATLGAYRPALAELLEGIRP